MRLIGFFAIVSIGAGLLGLDRTQAADVAAPGNLPVMLSVNVPEAAEIWIDGYRTSHRGAFRQFISPPIQSGREFTYTMRVKSQGKEQTQTLKVHAGDLVRLDFRGPSVAVATETASTTVRTYYASPEPARPASRLILPVEEFDPWRIELEMY
jgi:uncharacterized protein (TIGR03000 family)